MATLTVTEVGVLGQVAEPALVEQSLAIGANSVASAPFSSVTRFPIVRTDAACALVWGAAPLALPGAPVLGRYAES
jgi:hypothetical protein